MGMRFTWDPRKASANAKKHGVYAAKHGGRNAWVGLFSSDDVPSTALMEKLPSSVPCLLATGHLTVKSSFAPDLEIPWEAHAQGKGDCAA